MTPARDKGFTLIEVLIAFAILALTFASVFRAFSSSFEQERRAEQAVARALEARSILEEFGESRPLEPGEEQGELSSGETWTATVTEAKPASLQGGFKETLRARRVEIVVRDGGRERLRLAALKLTE